MRAMAWLGWGAAVLVGACAPEIRGAHQIDVTPRDGPPWTAGYDFDILADVTAHACVSSSDNTVYLVPVAGTTWGDSSIGHRALQAAAFMAINQAQGSDTILIERAVTTGDANQSCSTVWGKAIRLKKGTTITSAFTGWSPSVPGR